MKQHVLLFGLILGSFTLSAQTYFEKGTSGFAVTGGMQEGFYEDGYFGGLEYSYKGMIDVGVGYGNLTYNRDHLEDLGITLDGTPQEKDLFAYVEYWPLRSDPGQALMANFGIWAQYGTQSYKNGRQVFDNIVYDPLSGKEVSLGLDFSLDVKVIDSWKMQPYFWMGNFWAWENYEIDAIEMEEDYYGTAAGLGVLLQRMLANSHSIFLGAELGVDDLDMVNSNSFVLSIGYTFASKK